MTIPSSALPQPITVKHVFKLCDHHQLAQLHNAIYSRIPYDKEMTIAEAIDHNREYQHALALMQALASAPDITTGLILDMDIISEEYIVELPPMELLANATLTWDEKKNRFQTVLDMGIALLSRLMYKYTRKTNI